MPTERTPEEIARRLTKKAKAELLAIAASPTPMRCWSEGPWLYDLVERANRTWRSEMVIATDLGRQVAALLAQPVPSETEGRE